jgi:hypothetical protein
VATKPANYVATIAGFASATERHDIMHNASVLITGMPENVVEMQAADSITGAVYRWLSPVEAFNGAGYPGPNAPTQIAVRELKPTL